MDIGVMTLNPKIAEVQILIMLLEIKPYLSTRLIALTSVVIKVFEHLVLLFFKSYRSSLHTAPIDVLRMPSPFVYIGF